jgi:Fe-S cluster assembly protein SufD
MEAWRHTPLKALDELGPFEPGLALVEPDLSSEWEDRPGLELDWPQAVFVDGQLDPTRSSLPADKNGLVFCDLEEALANPTTQPILLDHLGQLADSKTDAFTALSSAYMQGGTFVRIPKNSKLDRPIRLLFMWTEQGALRCPRTVVLAEPGSHATVLVEHIASSTSNSLINGVTELFVEENAQLDWVVIEHLANRALHVSNLQAQIGRDGHLSLHLLSLCGHFIRNNVGVNLIDKGASVELGGLFLAGDEQLADHHTEIRHTMPYCESRQLHKGVLSGNARGVFCGMIHVDPHAQKTDSSLSSSSLLLSERARIESEPQLEIFTDDVKCSHGSTVGRLDAEALFYLSSRGIAPEEARLILTRAFTDAICQKLPREDLRTSVQALIATNLTALDEYATKADR